MTYEELLTRLVGFVRGQNTSSFFLNGPPRSGKTYVLKRLAKELPDLISGSVVLGPHTVKENQAGEVGYLLMQECYEAGFLTTAPTPEECDTLVSAWQWFKVHGNFERGRHFLVFIDLEEGNPFDGVTAASLFSMARYLENAWNYPGVHLFVMFAGSWDHFKLVTHFDQTQTSFPYTEAQNYGIWQGITTDDIKQLLEQRGFLGNNNYLFSKLIYELTGGYTGAVLDILAKISAPHLQVKDILTATQEAAAQGKTQKILLSRWQQVPKSSLIIIQDLMLRRYVVSTGLPDQLRQLEQIALIRRQYSYRRMFYIGFHSWYIELTVRFHVEELGISSKAVNVTHPNELMPPVSTVNVEAYRLIYTIENLVRNFLSIQLDKNTTSHNPVVRHEILVNMQQDAVTWRDKSYQSGLPVELNPLLAYTSTRMLAESIRVMGRQLRSQEWQTIANSMLDLAIVRDAVMHNQLIDEVALQQLYDLQRRIYEAISNTT